MNRRELADRARQEARGVWAYVLRRPVRTAALVLAATVVGGALANGVVTLFRSPFEAPGAVLSSILVLVFAGALTWGIAALLTLLATVATRVGLRLVFLGGAGASLAARVRRYGVAGGALVGALVVLIVADSALLGLLFAVALLVAVLALTGERRRHSRQRRWLLGHIAEAAKEFDPEAGGGWDLRTEVWDGERLVSAEAWYPASFQASDPKRRAAIERSVMWAMRHEPQTYGLEWPAGARLARIVSEPPLPARLLDGLWPPAPGIVLGACALVHADVRVRDEAGQLLGLRTWDPEAERDLLVAGVKGSGKTILMRGIVVRGLAADWFPDGVIILDGKASGDYAPLEGRRGILVVARTPEQWRAALGMLVTLMHERYEQMYEWQAGRRPDRPDLPRMLLLIDEIQAIIAELGQEAIDAVNALARMARGAHITLVVGTQRPDAKDAVPGAIRDQLEDRIAVGYMSPDGARMVLEDAWRLVVDDDDETGLTANTTKPRGRAVARIAGRLCRIQVPWLDSPVIDPGVDPLYPPREDQETRPTPEAAVVPQPRQPHADPRPATPDPAPQPEARRRRGWTTE